MDTGFMKEYYHLKYPDTFMVQAVEDNEKCRELYQEIMCLEGKTEDAMRSMGRDSLALCEKLFSLRGKMEELILQMAYLQGAADRDKMLR